MCAVAELEFPVNPVWSDGHKNGAFECTRATITGTDSPDLPTGDQLNTLCGAANTACPAPASPPAVATSGWAVPTGTNVGDNLWDPYCYSGHVSRLGDASRENPLVGGCAVGPCSKRYAGTLAFFVVSQWEGGNKRTVLGLTNDHVADVR